MSDDDCVRRAGKLCECWVRLSNGVECPYASMVEGERYPDRPGHKDDNTSAVAAAEVAPKVGTIRAEVLQAIRATQTGLTADQAASAIGRDFLSVRPRLTELCVMGKLVKTTRTRTNNRSGKQAAVYNLVNEYQRELVL